jgi:hypothetical protein
MVAAGFLLRGSNSWALGAAEFAGRHSPQRGWRGRQIMAPRSIKAAL